MESVNGTLAQWSALVGFVAPFVLAFVQQGTWSAQLKSFVTFAFAALAAIPTAYLAGDLTGSDWFTSAVAILTVTLATYHGFAKPSGLAPAIEGTTNVRTGVPKDIGDPPIDET